MSNVVDAYELSARTRGPAFDIRADTDLVHYHKRSNPAANALGQWRCTFVWSPALERPVLTAMVDTATAKNLAGQVGL
jgi:hypothetical protein